MASSRWLKPVPEPRPTQEEAPKPPSTPNVSMSDVRRLAQEKAARAEQPEPSDSGQPVNRELVDQSTSLDDQLTANPTPAPLVNQLTSQTELPSQEAFYRSRRDRRLKGIRFPASNLEHYELWCLLNKVDFQDAADFAMNWLTRQPVNQLTGQPANQLTTLINNDLNNELVINDEKAKSVFAKYTELTGKPVTQKDKDAYAEVAQLDYAVIIGGLETALRRAGAAGSRVNSFRYALNCIHEIAKLSASQQPQQPATGDPADYSKCPDCGGSGFYYPKGYEGGVAKCKHEKLIPGADPT